MGKAHGWGTFPKCKVRLDYCLVLGPLFFVPFFLFGKESIFWPCQLARPKNEFLLFWTCKKNRLLLFLYYYFQRVHFSVLQVNKTKKWTQSLCLFVHCLAHHLLINNMRWWTRWQAKRWWVFFPIFVHHLPHCFIGFCRT